MRKSMIIVVSVILICAFGGGYTFLRTNPPLVANFSAASGDYLVVLVGVGNKSTLADIRIDEVSINDQVTPLDVNMQVNHVSKGFIVSDHNEEAEGKEYTFKELSDVAIPKDTTSKKQLEKLEKGTATVKDNIYAITIRHDEQVRKARIKYSFLGLSYVKEVTVTIPNIAV